MKSAVGHKVVEVRVVRDAGAAFIINRVLNNILLFLINPQLSGYLKYPPDTCSSVQIIIYLIS